MEKVEFNNDIVTPYIRTEPKVSKLVKLVMKFGISDPVKANFVLLLLAIIVFIISIIIIVAGTSEDKYTPVITDKDQILIQMTSQ